MSILKRKYYIGIDIGGTKCAVVAGTEEMKILEKIHFPTDHSQEPKFTIEQLINGVASIIEKLDHNELKAIGISCGGPLNSGKGIILSPPNLPGWDNIPITDIFNENFDVPIILQNDANACALAEYRFGAGKDTKNMVFLTFGTGLGAGLILDGKLYVGTNDMAGEVGHIRLAEDGPEGYGKKGSFEGFCSGAGIARLARKIILDKIDQGIGVSFVEDLSKLDELTTKDVANAASAGDATALEIFETSAKYLGKGLSLIIDMLNPQRIVLGGVYARNPSLFEKFAKQVINDEAIYQSAQVCEIVPAQLGESVGDFASLSVAMSFKEDEQKSQNRKTKVWQ